MAEEKVDRKKELIDAFRNTNVDLGGVADGFFSSVHAHRKDDSLARVLSDSQLITISNLAARVKMAGKAGDTMEGIQNLARAESIRRDGYQGSIAIEIAGGKVPETLDGIAAVRSAAERYFMDTLGYRQSENR